MLRDEVASWMEETHAAGDSMAAHRGGRLQGDRNSHAFSVALCGIGQNTQKEAPVAIHVCA